MIDFHNINRGKHFTVPIELCQFAIQYRSVNQFRLYILLKWYSSGKLRLSQSDLKGIAIFLSCSKRTIKNLLKNLLAINWIGFNPKSQIYFIRGFYKVCEIERLNSIAGAWFEFSDFETFEAFCAATIFAKLIKIQKRRRWLERKKAPRSKHTRPVVFFPIAVRALAKILNISESKSYRIKKLAKDAGYIEVKKKLIYLNLPLNQRNCFPDESYRIRTIKGKLFLIEPDEIQTFILLKKRNGKKQNNIRSTIKAT